MVMMMMVRRMVIRIILGSYLQFGGTVSRERGGADVPGNQLVYSFPFLGLNCTALQRTHCSRHCYFTFSRRVLLHVGSAMVLGTDYWDFTPCSCCPSPAVCHTSQILTMFRHSEIKPAPVFQTICPRR